jgi:EpsI family protein
MKLQLWSTVALLLVTLAVAGMADRRKVDTLKLPLDSIGPEIGEWKMTAQTTLPENVLRALVPTDYLDRSYRKASLSADLFIAFYALQRAGETMHSPKACLPGSGWEFSERGTATITVDGRQLSINKDRIQNAGTRMWILYWYQARNRVIADEFAGKLVLVKDALFEGRTSGSFVRIVLPDAPDAANEGITMAAQVIPLVSRCFRD